MQRKHETNKLIVHGETVSSTGCPAMDALDLAGDVLEGEITSKEIIARLFLISEMIAAERIGGMVKFLPVHAAYLPLGSDVHQ